MEKRMTGDNCIRKIEQISKVFLYALASGMLLWLSGAALIKGNAWRTAGDGFLMTLLRIGVLILAVACSLWVGNFFDKLTDKHPKAEDALLIALCLGFWGANLWWVLIVPYVPDGDQAVIWYNAVLNIQGDFSMFGKGGQMFVYPQQQGLSFLYELLFRITGSTSYQLIGYVNATLAPVTLLFGYRCVKLCFDKSAALRFLPLMLLCLPYTIYAPFVYGDIPSIALTFILFWAVLKAMQTSKKRYYVLACLIAAIALLCRMNMWIAFIGIVIGLFYHCLSKKSLKPLVLAVVIVLSASLGMSGLKAFNTSRANEEPSKGMPTLLWMAMGLQYSEYGAGYYNDYSKRVFENAGYDREVASDIAKQEIKDRIHMFLSDAYQARLFFRQKMQIQWVDGLFESTKFTGTFDLDGENAPSESLLSLYHGEDNVHLAHFSECMLCVVYVFAFIGVVMKLWAAVKADGAAQQDCLLKDIPLIIFVGGFLFSIIWEAKARYMLPYYVLLHMYAAFGLTEVVRGIKKWKCRCKR